MRASLPRLPDVAYDGFCWFFYSMGKLHGRTEAYLKAAEGYSSKVL
jgi:hypothetical protein